MSTAESPKPPLMKASRVETAANWWRSLQRRDKQGNRQSTSDPGTLARLRRAVAPLDAMQERHVQLLYRWLGFKPYQGEHFSWQNVERVATLAMVLAHIRADADGYLGQKLGGGEQPVMSDLRVRRLCAARDAAETVRGFREAVGLLGGTAPVKDTAALVLDWLDDDRRDRIRARFLFDYHGASSAWPDAGQPDDAA